MKKLLHKKYLTLVLLPSIPATLFGVTKFKANINSKTQEINKTNKNVDSTEEIWVPIISSNSSPKLSHRAWLVNKFLQGEYKTSIQYKNLYTKWKNSEDARNFLLNTYLNSKDFNDNFEIWKNGQSGQKGKSHNDFIKRITDKNNLKNIKTFETWAKSYDGKQKIQDVFKGSADFQQKHDNFKSDSKYDKSYINEYFKSPESLNNFNIWRKSSEGQTVLKDSFKATGTSGTTAYTDKYNAWRTNENNKLDGESYFNRLESDQIFNTWTDSSAAQDVLKEYFEATGATKAAYTDKYNAWKTKKGNELDGEYYFNNDKSNPVFDAWSKSPEGQDALKALLKDTGTSGTTAYTNKYNAWRTNENNKLDGESYFNRLESDQIFNTWTDSSAAQDVLKEYFEATGATKAAYTDKYNAWKTKKGNELDGEYYFNNDKSNPVFDAWSKSPEGQDALKALLKDTGTSGTTAYTDKYNAWRTNENNKLDGESYFNRLESDQIFNTWTDSSAAQDVLKEYFEATGATKAAYTDKYNAWKTKKGNELDGEYYFNNDKSNPVFDAWSKSPEGQDALKALLKDTGTSGTTAYTDKYNAWRTNENNKLDGESYFNRLESDQIFNTWTGSSAAQDVLKEYFEATGATKAAYTDKYNVWKTKKGNELDGEYYFNNDKSNPVFDAWSKSPEGQDALKALLKDTGTSGTTAYTDKYNAWRTNENNKLDGESYFNRLESDQIFNTWTGSSAAQDVLKEYFEATGATKAAYTDKYNAWKTKKGNELDGEYYFNNDKSNPVFDAWSKSPEGQDALKALLKDTGTSGTTAYTDKYNAWRTNENNKLDGESYFNRLESDQIFNTWTDSSAAQDVLKEYFEATGATKAAYTDKYNAWKTKKGNELDGEYYFNNDKSNPVFDAWSKSPEGQDALKALLKDTGTSGTTAYTDKYNAWRTNENNKLDGESYFNRLESDQIFNTWTDSSAAQDVLKEYFEATGATKAAYTDKYNAWRTNENNKLDGEYYFNNDKSNPVFDAWTESNEGQNVLKILFKNTGKTHYTNSYNQWKNVEANVRKAFVKSDFSTKVFNDWIKTSRGKSELKDQFKKSNSYETNYLAWANDDPSTFKTIQEFISSQSDEFNKQAWTDWTESIDGKKAIRKSFYDTQVAYKYIIKQLDESNPNEPKLTSVLREWIESDYGKAILKNIFVNSKPDFQVYYNNWLRFDFVTEKYFKQKKNEAYFDWLVTLDGLKALLPIYKTDTDEYNQFFNEWKRNDNNLSDNDKTKEVYESTISWSGDDSRARKIQTDIQQWAYEKKNYKGVKEAFKKYFALQIDRAPESEIRKMYDKAKSTVGKKIEKYKKHKSFEPDLIEWTEKVLIEKIKLIKMSDKLVKHSILDALINVMMSRESNSDNKGIKDGYIAEKADSSNTLEEFEKNSFFQSKAKEWIEYQKFLNSLNQINYYYKINDEAKIALKSSPVSQNGDHILKEQYDKFKIRSKAQYDQSQQFAADIETWAKGKKDDYNVQEKFKDDISYFESIGYVGSIGFAIKNKLNEFKQLSLTKYYEKDDLNFRNDVKYWAKTNKNNSEVKGAFIEAIGKSSPSGGDKTAQDAYLSFKASELSKLSEAEYEADDQFKTDAGEWAKTNKNNSEVKAAFIAAIGKSSPSGGDKTAKDAYLSFKASEFAKLSQAKYEANNQFKTDAEEWAKANKDNSEVKDAFTAAIGKSSPSGGDKTAQDAYLRFKASELSKLSEAEYEADDQFKTDAGEWAKTNKNNSEVKAAFIAAIGKSSPSGGDKTAKDAYLSFKASEFAKLSQVKYEANNQFKTDAEEWAKANKYNSEVKGAFTAAIDKSSPSGGDKTAQDAYLRFKASELTKLSEAEYEADDQFKTDAGEWAKTNKNNSEVKAAFIAAIGKSSPSGGDKTAKDAYLSFKASEFAKLSQAKYEANNQFKTDAEEWAKANKYNSEVKGAFTAAIGKSSPSGGDKTAQDAYLRFKTSELTKLSEAEYEADDQFKTDAGEWAKTNKNNSEVKAAFIAAIGKSSPSGGDKTAKDAYLSFKASEFAKLSQAKYEANNQFKTDAEEWAKANKDNSEVKGAFIEAIGKSSPSGGDKTAQDAYLRFKTSELTKLSEAEYEADDQFKTDAGEWAKTNKNNSEVKAAFIAAIGKSSPSGGDKTAKDAYLSFKASEFAKLSQAKYEANNQFKTDAEEWAKANKDNSEVKGAFIEAIGKSSPSGGDKTAQDAYLRFKTSELTKLSEAEYEADDQFKTDAGEWAKTNKNNSEVKAAFIAAIGKSSPSGGDKTAKDAYLSFKASEFAKLSQAKYEANNQFKTDAEEWAKANKDNSEVKGAFTAAIGKSSPSGGDKTAQDAYLRFKASELTKLSEAEYEADDQFKTDAGEWAKTNKNNSEVKAAFIAAIGKSSPSGGDKTAKDAYLSFKASEFAKLSQAKYEANNQFKTDAEEWAKANKDNSEVKGAFTAAIGKSSPSGGDKTAKDAYSLWKNQDDKYYQTTSQYLVDQKQYIDKRPIAPVIKSAIETIISSDSQTNQGNQQLKEEFDNWKELPINYQKTAENKAKYRQWLTDHTWEKDETQQNIKRLIETDSLINKNEGNNQFLEDLKTESQNQYNQYLQTT